MDAAIIECLTDEWQRLRHGAHDYNTLLLAYQAAEHPQPLYPVLCAASYDTPARALAVADALKIEITNDQRDALDTAAGMIHMLQCYHYQDARDRAPNHAAAIVAAAAQLPAGRRTNALFYAAKILIQATENRDADAVTTYLWPQFAAAVIG